jgi:hypothetical protein
MISQILGAVMLIYLLAATLCLMAELWSSARFQEGGRITCGWDWGCHTGRPSGTLVNPTTGPGPPPPRQAGKLQLIMIQVPLSSFYES